MRLHPSRGSSKSTAVVVALESTGDLARPLENLTVQSFSTAGHPLWRSYSAYVAPDLHTWQTIADQNRP